jgi:hypothetical protein
MLKMQVRVKAIVEMFGRLKLCMVTAVGEQQDRYQPHKTLWVERGEDEYAIPHYKEPFCILYRQDWIRGEDQ